MKRYCQVCGSELVEGANFCKSCGTNIDNPQEGPNTSYVRPQAQKSYTIHIIVGYLLSIFVPLIGLIMAIYLITRDDNKAKLHAMIMIAIAVILWIVSFALTFG